MGKRYSSEHYPEKIWTLKEIYEQRNKILIKRRAGGLGDILMARLIFEDFKILNPDIKIVYACPKRYMEAVDDHPFIDEIVDCDLINPNNFLKWFDITEVCGTMEMMHAKSRPIITSPHRCDIWAEHCGIELTKHDMHLTIRGSEKIEAKKIIDNIKTKDKTIAFCPLSAISSKNLGEEQIKDVVKSLEDMGFFVYILHHLNVPMPAPLLIGRSIRNYMALIDTADFVITVDTAAFHVAGGLSKPQVAIFSWADGKVYGKYYKNVELVQKKPWQGCPCYIWGECPLAPSTCNRKPCITSLTGEEIIKSFNLSVCNAN